MHHATVTCRAVIGTILVLCLVGMTAAQPNAAPVKPESPAVTASAPCGALAGTTPHVRSVVLVMMENHATPVLRSMPYLHAAAARCGRAAGYHAVAHPSLPNYIALTSGHIPSGIRGRDCEPGGSCVSRDRSIFGQTHGSWRVWAQSMTRRCQRQTIGRYATRHTAAPYYTRIRTQCRARQIPLDGPRHAFRRRSTPIGCPRSRWSSPTSKTTSTTAASPAVTGSPRRGSAGSFAAPRTAGGTSPCS
jgi:hypothetical protein